MSKEKVERYKKEKAGRKLSLKKEKRLKAAMFGLSIVIVIVGAGVGGYYAGNDKGYTEGFTMAGQFYSAANASSSAIASGTSVTTENTSGSAAKTGK